ncbi:cell wall-binding repeat-containing protein [Euzebya tangerina]|uniref:cell wall-binding repeat-containing protein n=1 Tax=Euzebya tangerina TaxID=591198 RepID=UPI000E313604|nr:cell wall-binding repeat-containing protein [Euzebya tangerina]
MRQLATLAVLVLTALLVPSTGADATHGGENGPIVLDSTDVGGISVARLDGTLTEIVDQEAIHLEVSPDGRTALFVGTEPPDIQLISLAGGPSTTVLPRERGGRPDVSWSPDGSRFLVADGQTVTTYDADGLDPDVVYTNSMAGSGGLYDAAVWTAANEIIAINSFSGIRIDQPTRSVTPLSYDGREYQVDDQFGLDSSPDGQLLTVSCAELTDPPSSGICIFDRDLGLVRFIPPTIVPGATRVMQPAWSPDGTRLAFIALLPDEVARLYTAAVGGTDLQLVADLPADDRFRGNFPGLSSWAPVPDSAPTPLPEPPPPPTNNTLEPGGFDGDPTTTERADYTDPIGYAAAVSQARFDAGAADYAVVSRDDEFADSLVGTALTGQGPLLYTETTSLPTITRAELDRAVGSGGTVYLLGGINAISQAVEDDLARTFTVQRLAGPSRIETSVAVAEEVIALTGDDVSDVAIARAFGVEGNPTAAWADSVSVGAWTAAEQIPTVVTQTDGVHPAVQAFLTDTTPDRTTLLGGTAALSAEVEAGVPNPRRVAGDSRDSTAAAIATDLVGQTPDDDDRQLVIINGYRPDGWLFGLPAAGLAADTGAAIALAQDPLPPATATLACDPDTVDLLLAGHLSIIDQAASDSLEATPSC